MGKIHKIGHGFHALSNNNKLRHFTITASCWFGRKFTLEYKCRFLHLILTGDEKWLSNKKPTPQIKQRIQSKDDAVYVCVWGNCEVIIFNKFFVNNATGADIYVQHLYWFEKKIHEKRPYRRYEVCTHDNANPHATKAAIQKLNWEILTTTSIFAILRSVGSLSFPIALKQFGAGVSFNTNLELRAYLDNFFK